MLKSELVDYFVKNPKQLDRSTGKFVRGERGGKIFEGSTAEEVTLAKKEARKILDNKEEYGIGYINSEIRDQTPEMVNCALFGLSVDYRQQAIEFNEQFKGATTKINHDGPVTGSSVKITEQETDHQSGNKRIVIESDKPLSPKEIEELVQVDNISTFVDRSWLKSHKNNTWTYSILVVCKIKEFYTATELNERLKDIFAETIQQPTPTKFKYKEEEKALFIYIADDHAGLVLKDSLYGNEYSENTYTLRLLQIVEKVLLLSIKFNHVYIIRMGDEMDGYNGKTTRYDHDLGSLSNKEQFDIYTIANKRFYNDLFSSNIAENYHIISLSNSNHTGKGFSYIANKALEFWLEAKFPFVEVKQQEKFIDTVIFGNHLIGLTHGKDEKHMKSPMPLNLDYKTDLWLMEYYSKITDDKMFISTIKGDIHKYNYNQGKSGRYVNVPSISSGSNWIEHNYGDSQAGALLEIYQEASKDVISIPIWF